MGLLRNANQYICQTKVVDMRHLLPAAFCLCLTLLFACGGAKDEATAESIPPLTGEEVIKVYELYLQGNYAEYVAHMASGEGKTADYLRQMETLLKQHAAENREANGAVRDISVTRVQTNPEAQAAQAYMNVTYADNNTEEIQLLFVYRDGQWKLR